MDLRAFKLSDWLKVGGGALFLIAGPLTWWKVTFDGGPLFGSESAPAHGLGDYFGTVGIAMVRDGGRGGYREGLRWFLDEGRRGGGSLR
jgi:hypothetical protein